MAKSSVLAIAAGAALLSSPANAQFITNRADWNELQHQTKNAYIMGAFDQRSMWLVDDKAIDKARTQALLQCAAREPVTAEEMVKLVDEGYARDAADWTYPPYVILNNQMMKVCARYVSAKVSEASGK